MNNNSNNNNNKIINKIRFLIFNNSLMQVDKTIQIHSSSNNSYINHNSNNNNNKINFHSNNNNSFNNNK